MLKHIMDKWDTYLSILLGIFLIVAVKWAGIDPQLMVFFKYYVFAMIGVVIFDTVRNFSQHESMLWKLAAILSNGTVLASCVVILERLFNISASVQLSSLPILSKFILMPNFMLYLGIFLIAENAMWTYVYDHF